jgi:phenylalanine ammonia-lyase
LLSYRIFVKNQTLYSQILKNILLISLGGGNFLGEHVAIAMDRLRQTVGLMAKHLDVQIAQLVTPEFSNGLPACLVGNRDRQVNIGVKPLQICGNSIMPYLLFLGTPMADKFPTHAEQYNQNINSMGHMSACLARKSISTLSQHLSICLLVCVQALDLRANIIQKETNYDARPLLSKKTRRVYEAVRSIINVPIKKERSFIWDDGEHALDEHIARVAENLIGNENGPLFKALEPTIEKLRSKRYLNHRSIMFEN